MSEQIQINFFNEIIKGANMGIQSINTILPKCTNNRLKQELIKQIASYQQIYNAAHEKLEELGGKEQEVPFFQDFMSKINIELSTLFNKSASHIAEKLMFGNLMGIIGISKTLNKNKKIDIENKKFASMFINLCEQNLKSLKNFL